ncbi:MAG: hypothetical protein NT106_10380 [Candidatus Sumerlaeota bacterium]|nr:hypothetical protein [Candidatus Sumerlaeota bacterium]
MPAIPVAGKKEVKIGDWLSEAMKLTTENLGPHLLLGLVVGVIFIVGVGTVAGGLIVIMPLMCGMFFYAKKRMLKMPADLSDIFRGFDIFNECLVASLIILVYIAILLFVGFIIYLVVGLIGSCCPLAFLIYLPLILATLFMWAAIYGFIVLLPGLLFERRMKAWDAIQLNIDFAFKNFWMITLYGIVVSLIGLLGIAVTCGIGVIVVVPFSMFAGTIVYREWVGFIDEAQTPPTNTTGGGQPVG